MGIGLGTSKMTTGSDMVQIDGEKREAFDMYAVGNR